ncbi:PREDICTED: uncharacterized protein LOC108564825 isoform X2 [Nicrophorus vespilloides]|uniref:Uncharacterized protein LOC108564825 isoform X2 n=1 Tax=Nicrophorus vespilloides TaxID=110193 RepID=A0ABM1MY19_NICVS|nr:PREDICTED: uncharacterized protein LOC108564825 isoform X2 [Nicrophorus vespilloides]
MEEPYGKFEKRAKYDQEMPIKCCHREYLLLRYIRSAKKYHCVAKCVSIVRHRPSAQIKINDKLYIHVHKKEVNLCTVLELSDDFEELEDLLPLNPCSKSLGYVRRATESNGTRYYTLGPNKTPITPLMLCCIDWDSAELAIQSLLYIVFGEKAIATKCLRGLDSNKLQDVVHVVSEERNTKYDKVMALVIKKLRIDKERYRTRNIKKWER